MRSLRILILLVCLIGTAGCTSLYSIPLVSDNTTSRSMEGITPLVVIPRLQSDFDVAFSVALQPNGDFLTLGSWQSRGDYLYRWSFVDHRFRKTQLDHFRAGINAQLEATNPETYWIMSGTNIMRSSDSGKSWNQALLPSGSKITQLQTLAFFDEFTGFVGGTSRSQDRDTFEPNGGIEILCMVNGENFDICYQSNSYQTVNRILCNKKDGHMVALVDSMALLFTSDRGKTWSEKPISTSLRAITADQNGWLWAINERGEVIYSENLGDSWCEVGKKKNELEGIYWNSIVVGRNIIVVVGDSGIVGVSHDGLNWRTFKLENMKEDLFDVQIQGQYLLIQGKTNLYSFEVDE